MICPDAGPLGREVEHPGPIVAHEREPFGLIVPGWLVDLMVDDGLVKPEVALPLRDLSVTK